MIAMLEFVESVSARFALMTGDRKWRRSISDFDAQMTRVAEWYVTAPNPFHGPYRGDCAMEAATWRTLGEWVDAQYAVLSERITFDVVDTDPYSSADAMMADVDSGHLSVLNSATTGEHPLWSHTTNNHFRAVHDVMGHYYVGVGFDRYGEDAAYRAHSRTFPASVLAALATETRGQNAALNYALPYGVFKEQKCVLAPDWVIE